MPQSIPVLPAFFESAFEKSPLQPDLLEHGWRDAAAFLSSSGFSGAAAFLLFADSLSEGFSDFAPDMFFELSLESGLGSLLKEMPGDEPMNDEVEEF